LCIVASLMGGRSGVCICQNSFKKFLPPILTSFKPFWRRFFFDFLRLERRGPLENGGKSPHYVPMAPPKQPASGERFFGTWGILPIMFSFFNPGRPFPPEKVSTNPNSLKTY